jgi:hypothetical protein
MTAALAGAMLPVDLYKVADTVRTSTTTLADDPDLTVALDASATYTVEMHLLHAALDAERVKTAWTVPASATGFKAVVGPDQGVILSGTSSGGTGRWGVHNFSTSVTYGSRNSSTLLCYALERGLVTTTNAGTLALQWAQATSGGTGSRMSAGSYLCVKRIA